MTLEYGSSLATVGDNAFESTGLTTAYVESSKQSLFTGSRGWPGGVVFEGYGVVCADVGADGHIIIPNIVTSIAAGKLVVVLPLYPCISRVCMYAYHICTLSSLPLW